MRPNLAPSTRAARRRRFVGLAIAAAALILPWRVVPRSAEAAEPAGSAATRKPDDPAATALLDKARRAFQARSLTADYEVRYGENPAIHWRVSFLKPSYGRMELVPSPGEGAQTVLADGSTLVHILPGSRQYDRVRQEQPARRMIASPLILSFLAGSAPIVGPETHYAGTQAVGGERYEVVEFTFAGGMGGGRAYLTKAGLPIGFEQWGSHHDPQSTITEWLRNVKLDSGLTPKQFRFDPAGYQRADFRRPEDRKP